ncbi:hypothetical protein Bpla01_59110 [Burkholderia plantarii]|nr:hypothetical protein Bpla01_59110 [Burkholderia plantarii]
MDIGHLRAGTKQPIYQRLAACQNDRFGNRYSGGPAPFSPAAGGVTRCDIDYAARDTIDPIVPENAHTLPRGRADAATLWSARGQCGNFIACAPCVWWGGF